MNYLVLLAEVLDPAHCILDLHRFSPLFMIDALLEEVFVLELFDAFLDLKLLFISLIFLQRCRFFFSSLSVPLLAQDHLLPCIVHGLNLGF
jgi:hypothetical protein